MQPYILHLNSSTSSKVFLATRNYFLEFDAMEFAQNLIIFKVQVVICFVFSFTGFFDTFPKSLIVGCFSCIKYSLVSHIPKLQKAFSKCIGKQDIQQPVRTLRLLTGSEVSASLSNLTLISQKETCFWVICPFMAFSWLQNVCRSLYFKVLMSNS